MRRFSSWPHPNPTPQASSPLPWRQVSARRRVRKMTTDAGNRRALAKSQAKVSLEPRISDEDLIAGGVKLQAAGFELWMKGPKTLGARPWKKLSAEEQAWIQT